MASCSEDKTIKIWDLDDFSCIKTLTGHNDDVVENNYLYAALKIAEIFYLLNYSIYFYIYYLSGSLFRNQLKYSSKYLYQQFDVCFYILII